MITRLLWLTLGLWLVSVTSAFAVGVQFSGQCASFTWSANTELDLAGYKIYDRVDPAAIPTIKATLGAQVTSVTCAALGLNAGQHYVSISAFDTSGNESPRTADIPFVLVLSNQIADLRVTAIGSTDLTLTFTEVDDGTGSPSQYDVRVATPTIVWGSAPSVTSGTCATPVAGTAIGQPKTCTITGLSVTTPYQVQLVPYRGLLGSGTAVLGPLSNIASGTTGGTVASTVSRYVIASDTFTRADDTDIGPDWSTRTSEPWSIVSNVLRAPGTAPVTGSEVHSQVLPDRQWACVTLTTIAGASDIFVGPVLRASAIANTHYQFYASHGAANGSIIDRRIAGADTNLATETSTVWANGDLMCAEADGTALRLFRNTSPTPLLTATDATLTSGLAGLKGFLGGGATSNLQLDSYSSGGLEDRFTLFSDSFTRADGALGSDWIGGYTGWTSGQIVSNAVRAPSIAVETLNVAATVLPDDHWVELTMPTLSSTGGWQSVSMILRAAPPPTKLQYNFAITNQSGVWGTTLYGPAGIIQQLALTWVSGDVARAEARGNMLRLYRNNLLVMTVTDNQRSTGSYAGFGIYAATALSNVVVDGVSIGAFVDTETLCGC